MTLLVDTMRMQVRLNSLMHNKRCAGHPPSNRYILFILLQQINAAFPSRQCIRQVVVVSNSDHDVLRVLVLCRCFAIRIHMHGIEWMLPVSET